MQTIFALSSAQGKAGVAVFRFSGPQAASALQLLTKRALPKARVLSATKLYNPSTNALIDKALVAFFPEPASFTGEDVAELYTHGSIAVLKMLFDAALEMENVRLAEPGEFAKRAFLNGKMDLTEAEGLADLIDAETSMQHEQAIKQMGGALGRLYQSWKGQLINMLALLEASIDFPDDEIPESVLKESCKLAKGLEEQITTHLQDQRRGERLRNGLKLGIFGEPNVGKSSLMNYLSQREVSIVSSIPGTTRDVLESHVDIGGYPIILSDTAGIRSATSDSIEEQGINKALDLFDKCDIKILLLDPLKSEAATSHLVDDATIVAFNKSDLARVEGAICISCKTQEGMDILTDAIIKKVEQIASPQNYAAITRPRYRKKLEAALEHLKMSIENSQVVLMAEEVRAAINCIKAIIGEVGTEEVLDVIFANFCIGK